MAIKEERPVWFKFFINQKALIDAVPDEAAGKALKVALNYFDSGECPSSEIDPLVYAVFSSLKPYIDAAYSDFYKRVENGKKGGRPPKPKETTENQWLPTLTNTNQCKPMQTEEEKEEEEEKEKEKDFSFIHSCSESEENSSDFSNNSTSPRRYLGGIGKSVVFLSDDQISDLLDKLSVEEFDYYVGVVADQELSGKKYKKKTHYQAILDMAKKDRKIK